MVIEYGISSFTPNNTSKVSTLPFIIESVRVTDIILDSDHRRFREVGGWAGIGSIYFNFVKNEIIPSSNTNKYARPYFSNIKFYPLQNEVVTLIACPNPDSERGEGKNSKNFIFYYLPPTNLWNSPHCNVIPDSRSPVSTSKKSFKEVLNGGVNRERDNHVSPVLGETFKEKENITPLKSFEGDHILEGRWGNSIRFGSSVKEKTPWAEQSDDGDPITIIANTLPPDSPKQNFDFRVEDINNDLSSVYLTSTQKIPFYPSSFSTDSFGASDVSPTHPSEYKGAQAIITSGRLLLNAKADGILLSSPNTIHLSAGSSVNFDTQKITLSAGKIYLGSRSATEPAVLGNELKILFDILINLLGAMSSKFIGAANAGGPVPTLQQLSVDVTTAITDMKRQLANITSNTVKLK